MPYGGNLHIPAVLNNVAAEYRNINYIADAITSVPVLKEADLYYTFNRDWQINSPLRANGAPANHVQWGVSTSSYALEEWALQGTVTERERANSDTINLDMQTTQFLTDKLLLYKEYNTARLLFTTGTWAGNLTAVSTTSWRYNTTTVSPVQDLISGTSYIQQNAGVNPNTLILGLRTYQLLRVHVDITNRIQYVERALAGTDLLASMFDLPAGRVFVGSAVYDSGIAGQFGMAVSSITAIWGANALLTYVAPSPGMKVLSSCYNFVKSGYNGSSFKVEKWSDNEVSGDQIRVSTFQGVAPVATAASYYFASEGL